MLYEYKQLHFDHMRRVYCVCGRVVSSTYPPCLCPHSMCVCVCERDKQDTRSAIQNESDQVYFAMNCAEPCLSRRYVLTLYARPKQPYNTLDRNYVSRKREIK